MAHHEHAAEPASGVEPRPDAAPAPSYWDAAAHRVRRRGEKIAAEVGRNRRGEHALPTWVLAVILAVVVIGWAALVIFS
jgi:hypothetical protein